MKALATQLIKKHEGLRLKPYRCSNQKLTIGYGRNLQDNGISQQEAENLLQHDLDAAVKEAETLPYFASLNKARQAVIVDMIFNLGLPRFGMFKKMIAAIEQQLWHVAANEMLNSRWARQVGKRAKTLSEMMRTGAPLQ
ncbi:glycoside hydrolase family protein [Vibrio fluvialis]|uniref:glycoside hydrolase family protein n=1 Tax=Vibrio fluvialis TaxID=676 RepID=UPI00159A3004|nr:glycoside hydrolase family protein [Vibrio fluvialis]MCE7657278.1 glycoside hydrolase family protein [Vibrio fluvialis]QKE35886.1 glycoside hydrolase family protein [Vibrio fluvialis]